MPRDDDGATDVEMDPVSEFQVREVIRAQDLEVVGWYHSHPRFAADAAHARRVDLDRMWRASLPKWEKLLRSLAPHVLKMAVAPADRRGFLADVVLYVHVCFRAARARRKRSAAGGAKRRDHRTADPERSGLKDELESRGIQYSSKEGTAALRRKLENGA